jgi:hypothetical protein
MNKDTIGDLYTDFLLCSTSQAAATTMARMLDHKLSHDQITRWLTAETRTSADLWRLVKPLLRTLAHPTGVLIVDDSIAAKPHTDESPLVCWHYDHKEGRNIKGIQFLTACYEVGGVTLPVAFDLVTKPLRYLDEKDKRWKRKSETGKNERYRRLLHIAATNGVEFSYVLNDTWFASAENMKYVKGTLKKDFVMPLKVNRKVALSQAAQRAKRFQAVTSLDLAEAATCEIWLEEVPFALLLCREVFTHEDGRQDTRYLVTSDVTLASQQMSALYQRRWSIEEYHKSLKQNASLENAPVRTEVTQRNHIWASMCAYVKLEGLRLKVEANHFALKAQLYVAGLKASYSELVKLRGQLCPA